MQSFALRFATPADVEPLLALSAVCEGAARWSRNVWQSTLSSAHGSGSSRVAFVAVRAGEIIGFAVLHAVGETGEIENLGVRPSARLQGTARALCTALLEWAQCNGLERVQLEVRSRNSGAQAFYRKLGFVHGGTRPRYYNHPDDDATLFHLAWRCKPPEF